MFNLLTTLVRFCIQRTNMHRFLELCKKLGIALKVFIRFKIKITQKTWQSLFDFLKYLWYLYSLGLVSEKGLYSPEVGKLLLELFIRFFGVFEILLEMYIFLHLMTCFIRFVRGLIQFFIWLICWSLQPQVLVFFAFLIFFSSAPLF